MEPAGSIANRGQGDDDADPADRQGDGGEKPS